MASAALLVTAVVLVLALVRCDGKTPCVYDVCSCNYQSGNINGNYTIDCSRKDLTSLPPLKSGNFTQTKLVISHTSITTIEAGQLPPRLQSFVSYFTPLTSINPHSFNESSATLQELDIYGSSLDHIPDALAELKNLTSLSLADNKICNSSQVSHALYPLRDTLTSFTLQVISCLTRIPDLSNMMQLKTLSLDYNHIVESPTDALPNSLEWLSIRDNSLTEIPHTVSTLTNLTILLVASNKIQSVDTFLFPSSIRTLELYRNQIENITLMSFYRGKSELKMLRLEHNPIRFIAPDAFDQITKLTYLELSNTKLTRLPLALLPLAKLDLLNLSVIPTLKCTCEEASMAPWYHNITTFASPFPHRVAIGDCAGVGTVDYFLVHLAQNCTAP